MQPSINCDETTPIQYQCIRSPIELLEEILDTLPLVFKNKYWVIQNKYCHFIASINYDAIEKIIGCDKGQVYKVIHPQHAVISIEYILLRFHSQKQFTSHIYTMLSDSDGRIRNEAASALLEFNIAQITRINGGIRKCPKNHLMSEFIAEILSTEIPFSLDNPSEPLTGFQLELYDIEENNRQIKLVLGIYLFDLTNMLFDLKSSEHLVRNF